MEKRNSTNIFPNKLNNISSINVSLTVSILKCIILLIEMEYFINFVISK